MEALAARKAREAAERECKRMQDWFLLFGDEQLKVTKKLGKKPVNNMTKIAAVELREIERDRHGRYLYEKILHAAPENLHPPSHYFITYKLPGAPFSINVALDNPVSHHPFSCSGPSVPG
jgi:hypothetical protein